MYSSNPKAEIDFLTAGGQPIWPLIKNPDGYHPLGHGITNRKPFKFSKSRLTANQKANELVSHYGIIRGNGHGNLRYGIRKKSLKFNHYHPRIFRPSYPCGDSWEMQFAYLPEFITARKQLVRLIRMTAKICETIHPTPSNFMSHGMALQEALILACAACEAQWKGILNANNYSANGNSLHTKDYVKLRRPLKLDEYEIQFKFYPDLPPFKPYEKWQTTKPTKSLRWYDAYNKVKHNFVDDIHRANLKNLLNAVSALVIINAAQMGEEAVFFDQTEVGDMVFLSKHPQFPLFQAWSMQDCYFPLSSNNSKWISTPYKL